MLQLKLFRLFFQQFSYVATDMYSIVSDAVTADINGM
jgi:hypothetical protein